MVRIKPRVGLGGIGASGLGGLGAFLHTNKCLPAYYFGLGLLISVSLVQ